jgi:hypothetical protein
LSGIALGEDGVESLADLTNPRRDRVALTQEQVPIEVEIGLQIRAHQRLAGIPRIEQLIETSCDFVAVDRTIQVGVTADI